VNRFLSLLPTAFIIGLVGCKVFEPIVSVCDSTDTQKAIVEDGPESYFIGRRMYKVDYKIWGWIRKPRERWGKAKLAILNEQTCLAPDRKQNRIGFDNNYEYCLRGYFSSQTVYEPASNQFYPEFVLLKADLLSIVPTNIYQYKEQLNPSCRLLVTPHP
jgi:hypothetical protein